MNTENNVKNLKKLTKNNLSKRNNYNNLICKVK